MEYLGDNIIDYVQQHVQNNPEKTAFKLVNSDLNVEKAISYLELHERINYVSRFLKDCELDESIVILYYQDEIEFIISFLACISIGAIPVPVSNSKNHKHFKTLNSIISNSGATAILYDSESSVSPVFQKFLQNISIPFICTENFLLEADGLNRTNCDINEVAFILYTSGSTRLSKGVIISHENMISNLFSISNTFNCQENSVIFSWLPFHHDMGLVGNLLQTIFVGASCIILSPSNFIKSPRLWLFGISKFRATHSGGPNFSYDLCVEKIKDRDKEELDLSSWLVAFNGAEPVQYKTIQKFTSAFKSVRFSQTSFCPCYGLAEATLLVSAAALTNDTFSISVLPESIGTGKVKIVKGNSSNKILTSSGSIIPEIELLIVKKDGTVCEELEEGEICLLGKSISNGYLNYNDETSFLNINGKKYLRTGDVGFIYSDQLFVNGRIKEMLVVRGVNYYPYDIELLLPEHIPEIRNNGVAVIDIDDFENSIVVIAEVKRRKIASLDSQSIVHGIESLMKGFFGVDPKEIILVSPFGIPRTTSGKLQRVKCREIYRSMGFKVLASKSQFPRPEIKSPNEEFLAQVLEKRDTESIKNYLIYYAFRKTGVAISEFEKDDIDLVYLGVDSLKLTTIINTINTDLKININPSGLHEIQNLSKLVSVIETLLWLENKPSSEEEIII